MRVQDGHAVRQTVGADLVMVRHDHIQSQFVGYFNFKVAGDAAIGGDHQGAASGPNFSDGIGVESISLGHALGKVIVDSDSEIAEKVNQESGGGYAVHIVIAKYGDFLARFNRLDDSVHGFLHSLH